jgi:YEATS domain-containing protein 4
VPMEVGKNVHVPIVYGSIAFWLGKQVEGAATHEWVLYVRGSNNESLEPILRSVTFHLHSSFENPERGMNSSTVAVFNTLILQQLLLLVLLS